MRRATSQNDGPSFSVHISIHALLAESDDFRRYIGSNVPFLSTLSLRRATQRHWLDSTRRRISIHALLAESDVRSGHDLRGRIHFYPRSPCGERRTTITTIYTVSKFLSTLSLRRATPTTERNDQNNMISIHALLAESDIRTCQYFFKIFEFLSTLSLRRATALR